MTATALREQRCPDCGHARPIGLDGVIEAHTALRIDYAAEGQPVRREWCQDAFSRAVRRVLSASTAGRLDDVVSERWEWVPELEAVAWLRRMQLGWSPLSHEEIVLDHARWLLGPSTLLNVARDHRDAARASISSSTAGRSGGPSAAARAYRSSVEGSRVIYRYEPEPEGTLRVVELLDVAAQFQSPSKVEALEAAVAERTAVVAEETELFGPFYVRTSEVRASEAYRQWESRRQTVEGAMHAAAKAWWAAA